MKKLIVLLPLALLYSCSLFEKEEEKEKINLETFVEGRVLTHGTTNPPTTQPMPLKLMYEETTSIFGGREITVDETTTDETGYYSFSFTAHNHYTRYFVRLMQGAGKHHGPSFLNYHYLETGKHQTRNIYLSPHAWLKLHIENVNPQPGDIFTVNWGGGVYLQYFGAVNEIEIIQGGGNINRIITFNLKRNNEYLIIKDTVWMPAFDTTYHKIEY
ncbi:MAG: hypothetical protein JJU02_12465 [Cryomorphaceae bacterium]|nr:hypothetical protein [Cryomorphaceae bacterium]